MPRLFWPAVFTFLLFALASGLRATHPIEAITQFAQFAFIFCVELPVLMTVVTSIRMVQLMLGALTTGTLAGIIASLVLNQAAGAGRTLAFFSDNPNRLGYPLAYLLPFVLHYLAIVWKRNRRRAMGMAVVTLYPLLWAVAASATRGGATAAIVSFLLYVVFLTGWRGSARRLVVSVVSATLAVIVLLQLGVIPNTLEQRVTRSLAGGENSADLIEDRENLAIAAGRAIEDSPFLGTGLDNFKYVSQWYETRATPQAPHNVWLSMLTQVGVIGTFGFAFIIVTWFELMFRCRARGDGIERQRLAWCFICSMVGIMMIFMATPLPVHRHYWLIYGLGLAMFGVPAAAPERQPALAAAPAAIRRPTTLVVVR